MIFNFYPNSCARYLSLILLTGGLATTLFAQQKAPAAQHKSRPPAVSQPPTIPASVAETPQPATLASAAYLTGEAEVAVQGNRNPVIRLGLARDGAALVEFPATDFLFAVHPGSANLIAVEESPTLATDHYLVFRAGPDFAPLLPETRRQAEPQAAVSVQMQSGLFLTFLFYPVSSLAEMAHRCVVRYSRAEVVAARRAAGLAVNLDDNPSEAIATPVTKSSVVKPLATLARTPETVVAGATEEAVSVTMELPTLPTSRQKNRAAPLLVQADTALRAALAAPGKFAVWSKPTHGLSLSVLPPSEAGDKQGLTVVAVRNTLAQGVPLIAPPVLETVTLDERG